MGQWSDAILNGPADKAPKGKKYSDAILGGAPAPSPASTPAYEWQKEGEGLLSAGLRHGSNAMTYMGGTERREPGIEELPNILSDQGATAAKMSLGIGDAAKLDIIKSMYPGIQSRVDKWDNAIVTSPEDGEEYYLNKPGPSGQDAWDVGTGAAALGPFARAGQMMFKGFGFLPQVVGTGLGLGTGTATQNVAATAAGSEQPITDHVIPSMVLGSGLHLLSPVFKPLFSQFQKAGNYISGKTGEFTSAGKEAIRRAGFSVDEVTAEMNRVFGIMAKDAVNPEEAVRSAAARSLPVPVRMSRGDITRRAGDQMTESNAASSVYGENAERIMSGHRAGQQAELRANVPAIQQRLAGGQPTVMGQGDAGEAAQRALGIQQSQAKAEAGGLYDTARAANAGTEGAAPVRQLAFDIGNNEAVALRVAHSPKAQTQLDKLQALTPKNEASVPVNTLFDWRRNVSTLANETRDETEKAALNAMKHQFDTSMKALAEKEMIAGDPAAIDAWHKAIQGWAGYAGTWKSGDILQKLTQMTGEGANRQLKLAPEAVSNYLFGGKTANFISRPELLRTFHKLKRALPEAEWNMIREEAWLRIANTAEGAYEGASRQFSGVKLKKTWDQFQMQNKDLVGVLFKPEERKLISQFARVAADATGKVPGGFNPSGTGASMANMMQKFMAMAFLGDKSKALMAMLPMVKPAANALGAAKTVAAVTGGAPRRVSAPSGFSAFGTASSRDQGSNQMP